MSKPYQTQSAPNSPIYGVILAGGEGQRLWPFSRRKTPKYSICIGSSKRSLLQQAFDRLKNVTAKDKIFVVIQKAQLALVKKQLPRLDRKNIIVEPFGRNTAAAIGLAAVVIGRNSPDAVMVVVPADQYMPASETSAFCDLARNAAGFARANNSLVTVGVKPVYPATGFGYIRPSAEPQSCQAAGRKCSVYKAAEFVEKPDLETAKRFVKKGYLWNSGIFVWEVTAILEAMRGCLEKLFEGLSSVDNEPSGPRFQAALLKVYKGLDSISIDCGVLEKSKNVFVIPSGIKWDDIGSWLSFARISSADKSGNTIDANFIGIDTKDCIIISKDKRRLIATYGLKDMIVVETADATLVCSRDKAERIKDLVNVSDNRIR